MKGTVNLFNGIRGLDLDHFFQFGFLGGRNGQITTFLGAQSSNGPQLGSIHQHVEQDGSAASHILGDTTPHVFVILEGTNLVQTVRRFGHGRQGTVVQEILQDLHGQISMFPLHT